MKTSLNEAGLVEYALPLKINEVAGSGSSIDLNQFLGRKIIMDFKGEINCVACNRLIKKSFNQGYCYPCFQNLAECDICIVKPELCHYDEGSCRDNDFAASYCNIPHSVYISLTSSVKVGITRANNEIHRWIDQGAVKAQRVLLVKRRKFAGLVEVELAKFMQDKTDWRKMLKNEYEEVNLTQFKQGLAERISNILETNQGIVSEELIDLGDKELEIKYPVLEFPKKINSFNLDKVPCLEGVLMGIKGQYLILDTGVINIRKYAGYKVYLEVE